MPAIEVISGTRVSGSAVTLHTGKGWLLAVLVSHGQAAAQTVTFYDNTAASGAVILTLTLPANPAPCYVEFLAPIAFSQGLTVAPAGADVNVWAKGR